ncbi:hypothetical protein Mapa_005528 [Marchantia paleacea]|nr:hypothetical protein Mapa_005528 [Marchantia paleacea]
MRTEIYIDFKTIDRCGSYFALKFIAGLTQWSLSWEMKKPCNYTVGQRRILKPITTDFARTSKPVLTLTHSLTHQRTSVQLLWCLRWKLSQRG